VASSRATNTSLSAPERKLWRASFAVVSFGIHIRKIRGAVASVCFSVPDLGSITSNTLSGIYVEERSLGVAVALGKNSVEGESGRAALAFLSNVVPMGIGRAALACFGCSVPEVRSIAADANTSTEVRLFRGAVTFPGSLIQNESSGAVQTFLISGIPDSWFFA